MIYCLRHYDVQGSIAHVKMLGEVGLMTKEESEIAVKALEEILTEIQNSTFKIEDDVEDIHSQIELLLTRTIGELEKKFIAARSRNDQVVVDIKLFLRAEILKIKDDSKNFF